MQPQPWLKMFYSCHTCILMFESKTELRNHLHSHVTHSLSNNCDGCGCAKKSIKLFDAPKSPNNRPPRPRRSSGSSSDCTKRRSLQADDARMNNSEVKLAAESDQLASIRSKGEGPSASASPKEKDAHSHKESLPKRPKEQDIMNKQVLFKDDADTLLTKTEPEVRPPHEYRKRTVVVSQVWQELLEMRPCGSCGKTHRQQHQIQQRQQHRHHQHQHQRSQKRHDKQLYHHKQQLRPHVKHDGHQESGDGDVSGNTSSLDPDSEDLNKTDEQHASFDRQVA